MLILKLIWKKWKEVAKYIAIIQAKILFTVFYFTFLAPLGIVFSLFKDDLKIHTIPPSIWIDKINQKQSLEEMKRQF